MEIRYGCPLENMI